MYIRSLKVVLLLALGILLCTNPCFASADDVSSEKNVSVAEQKLLGKHLFSLQWIGFWEYFGTAIVTKDAEGLKIDAKHEMNGDYVTMQGTVKIVNEKHFIVTGKIVTRVSDMNNGQPCVREGSFDFMAKGNRKYWRLQQMENPCDTRYEYLDYIDVFFN